jgi:hypothetical protein
MGTEKREGVRRRSRKKKVWKEKPMQRFSLRMKNVRRIALNLQGERKKKTRRARAAGLGFNFQGRFPKGAGKAKVGV